MSGCVVVAIHVVGLAIFWAGAAWVCAASGGTACIAALVAAGIISAFAYPSLMRAYRRCRAGQ